MWHFIVFDVLNFHKTDSMTCSHHYVIDGFTLTVMNDFCRFLSQFSTDFHEILRALFYIHVVTTTFYYYPSRIWFSIYKLVCL